MRESQTHDNDPTGLFQKNLQFLHHRLTERILKVDLQKVWEQIEVVSSGEGDPVCKYKENGSSVHINSIDPLGQAEQWCNQIPLEDISALYVYGCGFGYPLFEILKKKESDTIVLVFEQNIHLFIATLHYFDFEPLFRTQKFAFFIGDFEDFRQEFQQQVSTVFFGCTAPSVVFSPEARLFQRKYVTILRHVFEWLGLQLNKMGNDHMDSLIGFHHITDNLNMVMENPYLSSLKDKFKNVPAFIIANGPSLDKSMPELKKIEGKALIISSESAILPLMKNKIKPDAVCVLERTSRSYHRHFENQAYPEDMSLLALAVVDSRIFLSFAGPKIPIFRNSESNSIFFNGLIGDGSALFGGKSSAHLAYEAAVYMGANPIVLVGQDLAYGPDGETHSKQSVYAEEKQKSVVHYLKSLPIIYVESNEGKNIPSNRIWNNFKLIFEQMIEKNPHITVINTTESGAKINGTVCDKLPNIIGQYCLNPLPQRLHTLINENKHQIDLPVRKNKVKDLMLELEKYISIYRALCSLSAQRRRICERMLELSEQEQLQGLLQQLSKEYENNMVYLLKFLQPPLHVLYFQQVIFVAYHQMNEMGPINSPHKYKKLFKFHFELFDHLNIICQSLVRNFQIALDKITAKGL